jgi:Taurine catabolism dioxygenase TauD, TfdA family
VSGYRKPENLFACTRLLSTLAVNHQSINCATQFGLAIRLRVLRRLLPHAPGLYGGGRQARRPNAEHRAANDPERIEGLYVIHDHDFIIKQSKELSAKQDRGSYDELPPVRHPLVQLHPVTRRRCLFLSPHTMDHVDGMAEPESRALLDELIAHAVQPKYVYRHVWAEDDVIMWDNRCTMHSVEPFDNAKVRRIMHRVTLVGEGPPIAA